MLWLLKHEVSNYFANMGSIHIYNHLTNQLINQSTISGLGWYFIYAADSQLFLFIFGKDDYKKNHNEMVLRDNPWVPDLMCRRKRMKSSKKVNLLCSGLRFPCSMMLRGNTCRLPCRLLWMPMSIYFRTIYLPPSGNGSTNSAGRYVIGWRHRKL